MASSREYLDSILEQLSGLERIAYRAMMGEFIMSRNMGVRDLTEAIYLLS